MKRGDFYKLTKLDMSSLGNMGTSPTVSWDKYFKGSASARAAAVKDFGKKINWRINGAVLSSGDLLHCMYEIEAIKTED